MTSKAQGRIIGTIVIFLLLVLSLNFISSSMSDSIYNYYQMNETKDFGDGGILIDSMGNINGLLALNMNVNATGIINHAHNFTDEAFDDYQLNSFSGTSYSVNFWIKTNINSTTGNNSDNRWNFISSSNIYQQQSFGQYGINSNNWNMITFVLNQQSGHSYSNHAELWINGEKKYQTNYWTCHDTPSHTIRSNQFAMQLYQGSIGFGIPFFSNSECITIGTNSNKLLRFGSLSNNYGVSQQGKYILFDEMSVFNGYTLTSDDITYLYNSGVGRSFSEISSQPPIRLVNFENGTLNAKTSYSINGYYSNYDKFNVSWFDNTLNLTQIIIKSKGEGNITIYGDVVVTLDGIINPDNILFQLNPTGKDKVVNFTIRAINNEGYDEQKFTIITSAIVVQDFGFVKTFLSGFTSFFPDKDLLNSTERFAFTLIIIIASVIGVLVVGKNNIEVALVLASIIAILEFIFFVFIGYVPVGIVIIMVLIGITLSYFKFKSGA